MGSFSPKKKFQARHWSPRFWLVGSPGFEPGSRTPEAQVDYSSVREDLITWLGSRNLGDTYRKRIIRELDRWVTAIGCPMDVVEVFSGLTAGQKNNLNRAIRALFNFLGSQGWSKDWLDSLRKNVPGDQIGIDVKVPAEARIVSSLQAISRLAVLAQTKVYLFWRNHTSEKQTKMFQN